MEQEVIADIARRVKKTGRYTETAELMAKSMVEQGYSAAKIQADVMKFLRADKDYQKAVAENTKAYKQEIQDIIDETVKAAKEAGNKLIAEAGSMAWNNDLSMWEEHGVDLEEPNDMTQLLESFKKQTNGQLKNITKTTGFRNTVLGTTGVMQAYQREMDLATLKVASGTFSYDEAVNECIKRLAQSGLRSIDYASGRTYQLDTAARMCVRTGMSQLAGKITEMNLQSTGQDLVRTSQHMGSRPEHAPWQNKVFSYSGTSKKYPDFFLETGYGTVEGLKGVNCTHDFYPYWEGDYIPPDVEPNEEYYNNTQKQRAMERGIRATKREIEAQKAINGDTTELKAKLKKQTADYYAFSDKVGIRSKDNRLKVIGGSSVLNKQNSKTTLKADAAKITIEIRPNQVYKHLTLDEFKAMKHSITKEERSIVYGKGHFSGYINSSNARKMNEIIRNDGILPSDYQEIADVLQGIIKKNVINENIMVYRYVSTDTLEAITGVKAPVATLRMSSDEYWEKVKEASESIKIGHVYTEKAFLSTSGVFDNNVMKSKGILLNIKVPKGTNGYITTNNKESEIIFGQNTKIRITGTKLENERTAQYKYVLDCEIVGD